MVDDGILAAVSDVWQILGAPRRDGILIICDHDSNQAPPEIDLGIERHLLEEHIAYDIGVASVAHYLVELAGHAAYLATYSRLIVDLNRYADDAGVIPISSDGHDIPGNALSTGQRTERLDRYFHPYHYRLERLLAEARPALIISLHSFTPQLRSDPLAERPWEIGVLYNNHDIAANYAIAHLEGEGIIVGDQLPYSGRVLNATMNRHAEAYDIPYVGIEIRQDLITDTRGQERFAAILDEMAQHVAERLASAPTS